MTRIHPSIIRRAWACHPLLPRLLPVCRDIRSAQNELRWIVQHVQETGAGTEYLTRCVRRRARGEPLQYVLGSEFFGDLEIKCRRGVLIPRQETAAAITYLVQRLYANGRHPSKVVRMLDLCSGSGCIPLLFHHQFYLQPFTDNVELELTGVDISQQAINLAKENQTLQLEKVRRAAGPGASCKTASLESMRFLQADILNEAVPRAPSPWSLDVLISNPPYISSHDLWHTVTRSVRRFEPGIALVPALSKPQGRSNGDEFYPCLRDIAKELRAKVVLLEVGDFEQACRVAGMFVGLRDWSEVEIWLDQPDQPDSERPEVVIAGTAIPIRGQGHGRSVFVRRNDSSINTIP